MLVPVRNMAGETVGEIELSDDVFGIEPHVAVMHQALLRQMANARLGTHETKTRGEVAGGGRKPWRQKGTGRARQGSTRAPQWKGGGTVFGPTAAQLCAKDEPQDAPPGAAVGAFGQGGRAAVDGGRWTWSMDAAKTREMVALVGASGRRFVGADVASRAQ